MHVYFLHGLVSLKFTLPVPVITTLSLLSSLQYEIAECLEDPKKIHGDVGEGLSFATGLIYQLATLQAVIKNIERYIESFFFLETTI